MRLVYAFPADAAQFTPDGKLQVMGGDFDTLYTATFPFTYAALALVMKLEMDPSDFGQVHNVRVELRDAGGDVRGAAPSFQFNAPRDPEPSDKPLKLGGVVPLIAVRFETPGICNFVIWHDDQEIGRIPLSVEQRIPSAAE